jgi:hypothetical protein|tara:strand:- start:7089 stop:7706 length:618 start_codon:yes stop_codon:yes gene_type:complete
MAHFAKVNKETNLVVDIIVVDNKELLNENNIEVEQKGIDFLNQLFPDQVQEFKWIKCSFWTFANERIEGAPETSSDGNSNGFRGNFPSANEGSWYPEKEKFINLSPFPSWTLNENDVWQAPTIGPTEEQCYYGTDPFVSAREAYNFPYNNPLIVYVDITNPEGEQVQVPQKRILPQWDESAQVWKGMHNDAQWRYWNGSSWSPSL